MNTKYNKRKKKFLSTLLFSLLLILFECSKNKKNKYNYSNIIDKDKRTFRIPVFAFHRLVPDEIKKKMYPYNEWVGSLDVFKKMIKYIYYNNYKTLSTKEFYKWYKGEVEYDKKTILIISFIFTK